MLCVESISFRAGQFAVHDLSFEVQQGEYFFILGQSGSGKSLTLEALAGLQRVTAGHIRLNGRDITHAPLHRRGIGLVFQSLALFPHLTVRENIAFPLRQMRLDEGEREQRITRMAESLAISDLLDRRPGSLSGGEHQRVALARTLVMKPAILLLDEPLSSLDILLKEELLEVLREVHRSGQTLLQVTHDYHEVAELAERIGIMENGRMIQTGTREDIIRDPRCRLAEKLR